MAFQGEIIPFTLRSGTGSQVVSHIRYPSMQARGIILLSETRPGSNRGAYGFGVDDGTTHVGNALSLTEVFGVCVSGRMYSSQYSILMVHSQAFFGGVASIVQGYVSSTAVGSFTVQLDVNTHAGAQWYAVVIGGADVSCTVGVRNLAAGAGSIVVGYTPAAVLFLNAPLSGGSPFTGLVAGANNNYGFGVPCEDNQVAWGAAAGTINSAAKHFQIDALIKAEISSGDAVGTVPSNTKVVSAWNVDGFSVAGSSFAVGFTDWHIGYMAIGGDGVAANLIVANQPTSPGIQTLTIDAAHPQLALFASTNSPTSGSVAADLKLSFGACDGLSQITQWVGTTNGAGFPYQQHSRSSTSQSLIMASATGAGTSTINAQAACTGLSPLSLNWTTTDATAREFWVLVLAEGTAAGVCGAGLTLTCVGSTVTITGGPFDVDAVVTLYDPNGNVVPIEVTDITETEITLEADLTEVGTYCATVTNPDDPEPVPPPSPPPPTPPPPGPGCVPLTPGAIPGLPAWFEQALIRAGATTCYDAAVFASIESEANAHSMAPQRTSGCRIRERLHEGFLTQTHCGHPMVDFTRPFTDHNIEHAGRWHWD